MFKFSRNVALIIALLAMVAVAGVVVAQDEMPAPGEGGIIVWGNQRGSANIGPLVDFQCSGVDCNDLTSLTQPGLLGQNPYTLESIPYSPDDPFSWGTLTTGWEISEDASSVTFMLRNDLNWSDGTPVTAHDVAFTLEAILNHGEEIGVGSIQALGSVVAGYELIDDYTIRVDVQDAGCATLENAGFIGGISPAHYYGWTLDGMAEFDYTAIASDPAMDGLPVTAGPFKFVRKDAGTAVYLEANLDFPDATNGVGVIPEGIVYLDVPDYNVMAERLLADQPGDVNYIHEPSSTVLTTLKENAAIYSGGPSYSFHYVTMNMADPNNPQPGFDEDGNRIDQGHHPILGDVRVRQALQHATNIEEVIALAQNGNAQPMVSNVSSASPYASPTLEQRAFDLDAARALLDEAGWVSTGEALVDGGDGLRTCQGCLYAEEGTEMYLHISAPDEPRTNVAVVLQSTFAELGIDLEVETLDFNTHYGNMYLQTFDLAVAGWSGGSGSSLADLDSRQFYGGESDVPDVGANWQSFYNEEWEELMEYIQFGAVADGCDPDKINEATWRAQEIMWEEQPYIWLYNQDQGYAVNSQVQGTDFGPYPSGNWQMDSWWVQN